MSFKSKIRTIQWVDNVSRMVDQTKIPYEYVNVDIKTGQEMYDAIQTMIVRGAPAIGIAGAHGVVLYAQELEKENLSREDFISKLIEKSNYLKTSRPTAVNEMWAVDKQIELIENSKSDISGIVEELKQNGIKIQAAFTWTEGTNEVIKSYVNGINTLEGGTHVITLRIRGKCSSKDDHLTKCTSWKNTITIQ